MCYPCLRTLVTHVSSLYRETERGGDTAQNLLKFVLNTIDLWEEGVASGIDQKQRVAEDFKQERHLPSEENHLGAI